MERKIGEIFKYNGEWYQCLPEICICNDCAFKNDITCKTSKEIRGECQRASRQDGVIFKKLEKVGETYTTFVDKTVQNYLLETAVTVPPKDVFVLINNEQRLIAIEIKQTKEDMEENKLNLKPFDIQKAREGKPVCTRDGRKVRIVCFDRIDAKPILALIPSTDGKGEVVFDYFVSGKRIATPLESDLDLMMYPEKKEGWVNVYKGGLLDTKFYLTQKEALDKASSEDYIATVKIEWEE